MADDVALLFWEYRCLSDAMCEQGLVFFSCPVGHQAQHQLWTSCLETQVRPNDSIMSLAEKVFLRRDEANLLAPTDLIFPSMIQHAVDLLKGRHLMLLGHDGGDRVKAVFKLRVLCLVDNWRHQIAPTCYGHDHCFDALADERAREDRLCQSNMIKPAGQVGRLPGVRDAWLRGQPHELRGMVCGVCNGLQKNLCPKICVPVNLVSWRKAALRTCWQRPEGRRPSTCMHRRDGICFS